MEKASCPSCGGELTFRSKTSVFCVCSYCRSNVVKHGMDLELIGTQADLQEDLSPIKIGTAGKFHKKRFQVVGRQLMHWEDGRWIEWFIVFNDGSQGWLAEAQGEFIVNMAPIESPHISFNELDNTKHINIDGIRYTRIDRKKVSIAGSEGELPFKAVPGSRSLVYDFIGPAGKFATVEYTEEGEVLTNIGEYVELKKLRPTSLRHLEGWGKV